jgi:hypothetical protein
LFAGFEEDFAKEVNPREFNTTEVILTDLQGRQHNFQLHSDLISKIPFFQTELKSQKDRVSIKGIDLAVFKKVIYFLYKNEISFDDSFDLTELLKTQFQWRVPGLFEEIVYHISKDDFRTETNNRELARILILARIHRHSELEKAVFRQIYFRDYIYKIPKRGIFSLLRRFLRITKDLREFLENPPESILTEKLFYDLNVQIALESNRQQIENSEYRAQREKSKLLANQIVMGLWDKLEKYLSKFTGRKPSHTAFNTTFDVSEKELGRFSQILAPQVVEDILSQMKAIYPNYSFEAELLRRPLLQRKMIRYRLQIDFAPSPARLSSILQEDGEDSRPYEDDEEYAYF